MIMNKRQLRLVIKTIYSLNQGAYDIYDVEKLIHTISGDLWRSVAVYDTLEDALKWHSGIEIIDRRKENEKTGLDKL